MISWFFWWYPSSILRPYLEIFTGIRLGSRCHVGVWGGQASKIAGKEPSHPKMKYEPHLEKIKWTFLFGDHLLGYPIRWVQFYVFNLWLPSCFFSAKNLASGWDWTPMMSASRVPSSQMLGRDRFPIHVALMWEGRDGDRFFCITFNIEPTNVCVCVSDVYYEVNIVFST